MKSHTNTYKDNRQYIMMYFDLSEEPDEHLFHPQS